MNKTFLNVVIYANCQAIGIGYFLDLYLKQRGIGSKIHTDMHNYVWINEKRQIDTELLNQADLFIYHPVDSKHGIYSSDSIMQYLKPDCIKIAFPFIYNSAFWPLLAPNACNIYGGGTNIEPIKKLKEQGLSIDQVLTLYKTGQIDFEYQKRFERCIQILREKETKCNVFVSDFIMENANKIKMFYIEGHPTTIMFVHCMNQIIKLLDPNDTFTFPLNYPEQNFVGDYSHQHTSYDVKFYNFQYPVYTNDDSYISAIIQIYNQC
jgi:hypothetical protein